MKRILAIAILVCLVLSLAGCGGGPSPEPKQNDTADSAQGGTQEIVIETGIGEDDEVTATYGSIAWDPEKMGGMPQPEGVTVFMEMDMTETLGQNFAYSYSVTGLTKEAYQKYIELVSATFPNVVENELTDTEGSFIATTEDYGRSFNVRFLEGNLSVIQYME